MKMKSEVRFIISCLITVMLSSAFVSGQAGSQAPPDQAALRNRLTQEQRLMLQKEIAKRQEIREAFKATLSQEQKNILTDPRMMRADRIKAFRSTLSDAQVSMIRSQQREMKVLQRPIRSNLTQGQKLYLRRMAMNRTQINRQLYRRARLHRGMGGI